MIINNQVIHTHEMVSVLTNAYSMSDMPEKTYRIKLNGKFVRIKSKSEWDKIGSAKNAFKAFLRRKSYTIDRYVNKNNAYNSSEYYQCEKSDLDAIYNQLIADNVLEFVEITN